jgi:hypothetical protein
MNGKTLKELAAEIPDHQAIDLVVLGDDGLEYTAAQMFLGTEMGTNALLVVQLPEGYHVTT